MAENNNDPEEVFEYPSLDQVCIIGFIVFNLSYVSV